MQPRPAFLDPQRNIQITEPDEERPEYMPGEHGDPDAGHKNKQGQTNDEFQMEEPVGQASEDHQGNDRGDDPGEPMQDQKPAHLTSQGGDSRLQETLAHQPLPGPDRRDLDCADDQDGIRPDLSGRARRQVDCHRRAAGSVDHTICLRFRRTHSSVSKIRNRPSTGHLFQSGIGGSVSRGTFSGGGRSFRSVSAVKGV